MVESTGLDSRANCALSHSRLWQLLTVIHFRSYFSPFYSHEKWRLGWGSNPRPLAWQASALTNWATKPFFEMWKFYFLWWKVQGSNLWPSACKADALPTELTFRLSAHLLYQSLRHLSRGFWKKVEKIFVHRIFTLKSLILRLFYAIIY